MEIRSGLSRTRPSVADQASTGSRELRKTDHISDIFNNRPRDDKERRSTQLHLSNASRRLNQEFREGLDTFLKKNPSIRKELHSIALPTDEGEGAPSPQLLQRKVGAYLQWLTIRESNGNEPIGDEESEAPYLAIHSEGKDDELRQLFEAGHAKRQQIQEHRRKNSPNYYYLVHPETYAFN